MSMDMEAIKYAVENRGFIRHITEECLRRFRVNILRDKGIYDIHKGIYFPSEKTLTRYISPSNSYSITVIDGLWKEDYGDNVYPSLYQLNKEFFNKKENIWKIWKFRDEDRVSRSLENYNPMDNRLEAWGTGWCLLSLQATYLSLKRLFSFKRTFGLIILLILFEALINYLLVYQSYTYPFLYDHP